MTDPRKDFTPIQDDYEFFATHSTEPVADLEAYAARLGTVAFEDRPLRMLDFGCGPGSFTVRFLERLGRGGDRLRLALVEPADAYRRQAIERLRGRTDFPIEAWGELPADLDGRFDLILSNHVFYYVPAPEEVLARILRALGPGGIFLTAIAGRDNVLVDFWSRSFPLIGLPVPYQAAEDVEAALGRLGRPFERRVVAYDLTFPDTEANRMKILRFLLADYLDAMPRPEVLALFDPYAAAGQIAIHTEDMQYSVLAGS